MVLSVQLNRKTNQGGRRSAEILAYDLGRRTVLSKQRAQIAKQSAQRAQAEFARAARVSMLGELTASIAHEVNQPLAAMHTNGEVALRWLDQPEPNLAKARDAMFRIIRDTQRAADIVARVRAMAVGRLPQYTELALQGVVEELIVFLGNELQSKGISVAVDLAQDLPPVRGDRTQLQQVMMNLAVNAIQAMLQSTTTRRMLLIRTKLSNADTLKCTFEDSGPGIDPHHLGQLFESFFTTKDSGMGLGLPLSRSIIRSHGGELRADNSSTLGGARFCFTLPVS